MAGYLVNCEFAQAVRMETTASTRAEMMTFFMWKKFIGETNGSTSAGPEPFGFIPASIGAMILSFTNKDADNESYNYPGVGSRVRAYYHNTTVD